MWVWLTPSSRSGLEPLRRQRAPRVTWRTGTTTAAWTRRRRRSSRRPPPHTRAAPPTGRTRSPPKVPPALPWALQALGTAALTASSLQSAQSLLPRGNGVSGSCSPAPEQPRVRQPHRENARERIPAHGRAWDERSFKVPLHPNHSVGLWFPESFSANPSQSSSAGM